MAASNWFGSIDLTYKYALIFGAALCLTLVLGLFKVVYDRRKMAEHIKNQELEAQKKGSSGGDMIENMREKDEGDLFGVRAIEAGFFAGIHQSRPTSVANSRVPSRAPSPTRGGSTTTLSGAQMMHHPSAGSSKAILQHQQSMGQISNPFSPNASVQSLGHFSHSSAPSVRQITPQQSYENPFAGGTQPTSPQTPSVPSTPAAPPRAMKPSHAQADNHQRAVQQQNNPTIYVQQYPDAHQHNHSGSQHSLECPYHHAPAVDGEDDHAYSAKPATADYTRFSQYSHMTNGSAWHSENDYEHRAMPVMPAYIPKDTSNGSAPGVYSPASMRSVTPTPVSPAAEVERTQVPQLKMPAFQKKVIINSSNPAFDNFKRERTVASSNERTNSDDSTNTYDSEDDESYQGEIDPKNRLSVNRSPRTSFSFDYAGSQANEAEHANFSVTPRTSRIPMSSTTKYAGPTYMPSGAPTI